MGDILVKIQITKMDPEIRKIQIDQLLFKNLKWHLKTLHWWHGFTAECWFLVNSDGILNAQSLEEKKIGLSSTHFKV